MLRVTTNTFSIFAAGLLLLAGCTHDEVAPAPTPLPPIAPENVGYVLPGTQAWMPTEIRVVAGQTLTITATGKICVGRHGHDCLGSESPCCVGPEGTYLYDDEVAGQPFPLPAAAAGPAPCYCLIGRIGEGPPFFIGRGKSFVADCNGTLWLGINDFQCGDNAGQFCVDVETGPLRPMQMDNVVRSDAPPGAPAAGCQVVVFYMDGLRPDVVREMAAMGHIPEIDRLFVAGGCTLSHTFTAFPSDTITSNGTMWTGCFSDRHGIKGQVRFSRRSLHSDSYLDPLGPHRSATTLAPSGWSRVGHEVHAEAVGHVAGDDAEAEFRAARVTGVPPLYEHLRRQGADWATGALPMMNNTPPLLWSRSLVRYMPYFQTHLAWQYIDDANTHFAQYRLLDREQPVTIIWLPETDSVSHKQSRGQFGMTRRTIARADQMIGQVVEQLRQQGRLCRTYFMLVSDHGHHGGQHSHLANFDIANQFFFAPRQVSTDGCWIGGGLGLSVRQHRFANKHPGDRGREFVFVDGDADGAARIFLPAGHYQSGEWLGGSRPADLLAYRIADHLPPVNLVTSLTAVQAVHASTGHAERPIDLVLVKLAENSVLISTADRGHAVIERCQADDGRWLYRYTVAAEIVPLQSGEVGWSPAVQPAVDPLGLLRLYTAAELGRFLDERTWLRMTAATEYPDGVVALTRHMLWQENLRVREAEFAPDLVVTARPGWYFGMQATKGTTHGYPLYDAMHAALFVSGPNIRRGARIDEPCRLADLTPTLLEMTGTPYSPSEMDGQALRIIYEVPEQEIAEAGQWVGENQPAGPTGVPVALDAIPHSAAQPVYWHELDLRAWHPLPYREQKPYEYLPHTINDPDCALDINNLARNVLTVPDLNVIRMADDVLRPVTKKRDTLLQRVEAADQHIRWNAACWLADTARILDLSNPGLGDYEWTTTGNLLRIDRMIDALQERGTRLSVKLAAAVGGRSLPGCGLANEAIDLTQAITWETYRFTQLVLVRLFDETALNSLEDGVDRAVNRVFHRVPAEVVVP